MSSTCFEQPSVHLREALRIQLYDILLCIYKQSGRCQRVFECQIHADIDITLLTLCKLCQETFAFRSLPFYYGRHPQHSTPYFDMSIETQNKKKLNLIVYWTVHHLDS